VIENTLSDLNFPLMNELALIFNSLGIDTLEVPEAAGTKRDCLPFRPDFLGGHCIGVDPYYLTHKALMLSYYPKVLPLPAAGSMTAWQYSLLSRRSSSYCEQATPSETQEPLYWG
jgi:hypothetical protein